MKRIFKTVILFILNVGLLSCAQSIENAQIFIATNDLQIGSNRVTFAVADKNGLVNSENIEVSFNGEGGYPKIIKNFSFVEFPDYYNTDLGNGVYTQIIDFEKAGMWKLKIGDSEVEFSVKDISDSKNVGDLAPRSSNSTINEKNIEQLTTGLPPINKKFYSHKIYDLLNENKKFILSVMSPAFCTDPTCGPQLETLNDLSIKYNDLPIVHVDTYSNPNQVKSDFENRKLNQIIKDYGINEDQWLFIISENGMIIAKFQGYASFEQIEEYLY
tara:strand:+ start:2131 stop:2946 length:816 start_codon:yes stop_codon:yes gene_type:complete